MMLAPNQCYMCRLKSFKSHHGFYDVLNKSRVLFDSAVLIFNWLYLHLLYGCPWFINHKIYTHHHPSWDFLSLIFAFELNANFCGSPTTTYITFVPSIKFSFVGWGIFYKSRIYPRMIDFQTTFSRHFFNITKA